MTDTKPVETPSRVRLLRDVVTAVGTYRAGLVMMATRTDDGWLLHLSLPDRDGAVHLEPVAVDAARYHGRRTATMAERKHTAHEEYQWARGVLGFDDQQATSWLRDVYEVSWKTLREWGFNTAQLETAERAERERRAS